MTKNKKNTLWNKKVEWKDDSFISNRNIDKAVDLMEEIEDLVAKMVPMELPNTPENLDKINLTKRIINLIEMNRVWVNQSSRQQMNNINYMLEEIESGHEGETLNESENTHVHAIQKKINAINNLIKTDNKKANERN